jgi:hypothetical protein
MQILSGVYWNMEPRLIFWVGAIFFTLSIPLKYSTLSDDSQQSALHIAAAKGNAQAIEYLLEHGAKADLQSRCNIFHSFHVLYTPLF